MISPTPGTRPYTGSCHCGATKFLIFLTFPHTACYPDSSGSSQSFHKCNCTMCHKQAILHIRVASPADDFILLKPSNPLESTTVGDYHSESASQPYCHWLFCKTCGGRCFLFVGEGENDEVDLGALGAAGEQAGNITKVWKLKKLDPNSNEPQHLSINAHSIDAGQAGFDLREWVDKGWLKYAQCLNVQGEGKPRFDDKPFPGGMY